MRGYTRASALGPIAEVVEGRGGSIERVFRSVDLPLALLDNPEMALPLQEQFRLLSAAGRETGDAFFGATLGREVKAAKLSDFGRWIGEAPTLAGSIDRANRCLNRYLQTATDLTLRVRGDRACWSIGFLDPGGDGRFQNELLGVSYLIDAVRFYAGPGWRPAMVHATCAGRAEAAALERVFGAPVRHGARVSAVEFDLSLLAAPGPQTRRAEGGGGPELPLARGPAGEVAALAAIALLEGQPRIDWAAGKLGMSRRSLQRVLDREGVSFRGVLDGMLRDRALEMVRAGVVPLTDIAQRLGYSDAAHFSRAFRRWTGTTPSEVRARAAAGRLRRPQ
ncbi:HTH-type transcriptional regulator VirS [Roseovarius sp. THAF27]|uniref:AraC family transcriptional regulator n=1 Tax=Roseovarius sp. THAF27 TaxID=2587850 RepID=UPI0012AAAB44|nr:AraC family transcriptional regulator [Roseovarius sp. THAF27]QFT80195.1 HTH-type transcriptional regulator VirS [Roseovarius sp. THAF27]